jgi:signal transduction histidine kinase
MRRHTWLLPACVAALAGLLVVLGTMQYRWLDQVAETFATEKRRSLLGRGAALVTSVERELTRTYYWFTLDESNDPDRTAAALAERWQSWRDVGRSVGLVKNLLVVRGTPGGQPSEDGLSLQELAPGSRGLVAVPWPEDLRMFADELRRAGPWFGPPRPPLRDSDAGPLLLIPGPERESLVVVVLDESYLLTSMLPNLAEEALASGDGGAPLVAVLQRGSRPPFSWPAGAVAANTGEHTPIPVFGVRPSLATSTLLSGARPKPTRLHEPRPARRELPGRRGFLGPLVEPPGPRGLPPDDRFELAGRAGPPRSGPFAVRREDSFGPPIRGGPPPGMLAKMQLWTLSVGYAGGPVDRLVASVRRRNLAISFGIMGVLGGAIAVLALAFRRSQRLAARQQEFLASVSHELRTPLAVIGSAAENLRDGTVEGSERMREYGAMIHAESRRLTSMVDDVLRQAAGQALVDNLHRAAIDLREVVDAALESLQPEIRARGGRVRRADPDETTWVVADRQAMCQAVVNVVANALKYGGDRPEVAVRIAEVAAPRGREVQVAVSDHGIGIPASEVRHIFEPFFRGQEALALQIHGTGLGLSLVARVMKAHGGRITVESTPGRGSCFVLRLPAAAEAGPA